MWEYKALLLKELFLKCRTKRFRTGFLSAAVFAWNISKGTLFTLIKGNFMQKYKLMKAYWERKKYKVKIFKRHWVFELSDSKKPFCHVQLVEKRDRETLECYIRGCHSIG